jgi:hypothetical protein
VADVRCLRLIAPAVRRTNYESSDWYQQKGDSYKQPAQYQSNQDSSYDEQYNPPSWDNEYQEATQPSYGNKYTTTVDAEEAEETTPMMEKETTWAMDKPSYETKSVEATAADPTSAPYAYTTPAYGSGQSNWGNSYNDCVSRESPPIFRVSHA